MLTASRWHSSRAGSRGIGEWARCESEIRSLVKAGSEVRGARRRGRGRRCARCPPQPNLALGVIFEKVDLYPSFSEVALFPIDLASEMAAARKRRDEKTARLLRESRVRAIQASVRPGSSREDIEECARSFYPRLREDLLQEAITLVVGTPRTPSPG